MVGQADPGEVAGESSEGWIKNVLQGELHTAPAAELGKCHGVKGQGKSETEMREGGEARPLPRRGEASSSATTSFCVLQEELGKGARRPGRRAPGWSPWSGELRSGPSPSCASVLPQLLNRALGSSQGVNECLQKSLEILRSQLGHHYSYRAQ